MNTARVIDLPVTPEPDPAHARELQKLWFSLAAQRWSSLLLVPSPGVASALPLANELAQIGRRAGLDPRVSVLDVTRLSLEQAAGMASQLAARTAQGERVLVAIDGIDASPAGLALAARCDAALLCLGLGSSRLASTRDTIERCGRSRFVGSVVLNPASTR